MNEDKKSNGIGAFRFYIILLLIIVANTPLATAADTMFRANAEHTGVLAKKMWLL